MTQLPGGFEFRREGILFYYPATMAHRRGDTPEDFGARLRRLRKARGISQVELSEMTGIAQETISRYEKGSRTPIWETVQTLEEALGPDVALTQTAIVGLGRVRESLAAFLETDEAAALEITEEEQEAMGAHTWLGADEEPTTRAWMWYLKARREILREKHRRLAEEQPHDEEEH